MHCNKCDVLIPDESNFCNSCGAKQIHNNDCPKCKSKLEPNSKFCHECGHNVTTNDQVWVQALPDTYLLSCPESTCNQEWNFDAKAVSNLSQILTCNCGREIKPKFYGSCPCCGEKTVFRNADMTTNVLSFGLNFLTGYFGTRNGYDVMNSITAPPTLWGYCSNCDKVSIFCENCSTISYDEGSASELSETMCTNCGRVYSKCAY